MQGGVDVEQAELDRLGVSYAAAKGNELDAEGAISWIRENGIKHIALHLDCDVMDPHDFYATYFNNPALGPIPYNAATGHIETRFRLGFHREDQQRNRPRRLHHRRIHAMERHADERAHEEDEDIRLTALPFPFRPYRV